MKTDSKKITIKLLLEKLVLIAGIIIFVNGYGSIFGKQNLLVGVVVVTATLMFMQINIGYDVNQSVFLIIGLFSYIGVATSLSHINPMLGLFINLISVFGVLYIVTEDIRSKAYLPFMLLYVFMEGNPIASGDEIKRILSILIGGVLVGTVLYLFHRKKNYNTKSIVDMLKEIDVRSERFKFSLKMAIGIGLAVFIGKLIGAQKGMWISIAVMSLTQPKHEQTQERIKKRLIATIIGSITFIILFKILIPSQYTIIATLVLGYIYTFVKEYGLQMVFVTINALTTAVLLFNVQLSITMRINFLIIGICIAYLISKMETIICQIKEDNEVLEI